MFSPSRGGLVRRLQGSQTLHNTQKYVNPRRLLCVLQVTGWAGPETPRQPDPAQHDTKELTHVLIVLLVTWWAGPETPGQPDTEQHDTKELTHVLHVLLVTWWVGTKTQGQPDPE